MIKPELPLNRRRFLGASSLAAASLATAGLPLFHFKQASAAVLAGQGKSTPKLGSWEDEKLGSEEGEDLGDW